MLTKILDVFGAFNAWWLTPFVKLGDWLDSKREAYEQHKQTPRQRQLMMRLENEVNVLTKGYSLN